MLPVSSADDAESASLDQNQPAQHAKSKGNFSIAAIMGHIREPHAFDGQCSPSLSPQSNFKPSASSGK